MEFVVFLRNVNLGQPGSPTRAQLETAFLQSGALQAVSFLSNGTLFFTAPESSPAGVITDRACQALRVACGMYEPVFVRKFSRLAALVAGDPFSDFNHADIAERSITFFDPNPGLMVEAPIESQRRDCLVFRIDGGDALSISREVAGKSGYPTPLLEKVLGAPVTTRSWTTILRLVKKFTPPAKVIQAAGQSSISRRVPHEE